MNSPKQYDADGWIQQRVRLTAYENAALAQKSATLLFVAGDRSQVGKTTVCLGILSALVDKLGYHPHDVAYIKPCTQCEAEQPVAIYCEEKGIECVAIGPVVFYSGFTRSFLAGEQGTSSELLASVKDAVRKLADGKRFVLVDGVGYPAVGSICGISNAAVASALGAPVVLVGKRGVGDAVDSFNLNASFFEARGCTVIGGIFNRISADDSDYYSLQKCKTAVTSYFQQTKPHQLPYGFVPSINELLPDDDGNPPSVDEARKIQLLTENFFAHVDVPRLVTEAGQVASPASQALPVMMAKKPEIVSGVRKSRSQVQQAQRVPRSK